MPILKLGMDYFNDQERPIYLLQGTATRDAEEKPVSGKTHAVVSVAAAKQPDGETVYVTLNGWRDQSNVVRAVRKRDSVLAVGCLKQREYNEKTYLDFDVDFLAISGGRPADKKRRKVDESITAPMDSFIEIPEDDGDGELPF